MSCHLHGRDQIFFSPMDRAMLVSFHRMLSHQSGFLITSSDHITSMQKNRKSCLNYQQGRMRAKHTLFQMMSDNSEQHLSSTFARLQLHGRPSTTTLSSWDQLQELVSAVRDSVLPLHLLVTPSNLLFAMLSLLFAQ